MPHVTKGVHKPGAAKKKKKKTKKAAVAALPQSVPLSSIPDHPKINFAQRPREKKKD